MAGLGGGGPASGVFTVDSTFLFLTTIPSSSSSGDLGLDTFSLRLVPRTESPEYHARVRQ